MASVGSNAVRRIVGDAVGVVGEFVRGGEGGAVGAVGAVGEVGCVGSGAEPVQLPKLDEMRPRISLFHALSLFGCGLLSNTPDDADITTAMPRLRPAIDAIA